MKLLPALALTLAFMLSACGGDDYSDAFGKKVRAYLLDNPEVLQEAYEQLQAKTQAKALAAAGEAIEANRQALEHDPRDVVINPQGEITVVEFVDFNCGYCKLIAPEVMALARAHPDVRFVFKDMPIFGETSEFAAAGVRMQRDPDGYKALHKAMMEAKPLEDADVARILAAHGVDPETAREKQRSQDQQAYLQDTKQLAVTLGIRGTPAFVVGTTLIPAADPAALKAAITEAQTSKG